MRVRRLRIWGLVPALLGLVSLLAPANVQGSGAAFVQATATTTPGTAKTLSLSFPANTTAGNLIVVAFDYTSGAAPSLVSDSQGNVFAPVGNQLSSPGGALTRVYYANTITGGPDTVTVTLTANSSWIEVYLAEYTGIDPVNPIDAQAGASGSASAVSSGTATTSVSGDVIFGYCVGDWNCKVGSGFSARSTFDGNLIEDKVAGAAGSYAATGTANNGWAMQMVALKAASGTMGAPPVITSPTSASGTVGTAFSYQIAATNSPTSYGATGLPAGLSVNSGTGLISGTPTTTGTSTVTLSATNSAGTGNATLTLTINPAPPVITSATTASGTVGIAFSYQITATNTPTSYGATGLPAGLSVNSANGLISGTPTAAGTSMVTLSATNAGGTGNATLTLTVNPAPPVITSGTTATGTVGIAFSYQITATNTPTSYGATGLPAGLSVNSANGLISGTPTAAGTSRVTLSATNAGGTGNATLTLTVNPAPPVITSGTTATGTVGIAFSYQITATNTPTSYGATGLPAGLSVDTTLGLISGTPTSAGTSMVTLSATNSTGTGNATLTLTINPVPPVITSATTASGTVGIAFSYQITATNTPTSYGATGLPAGLSVNSASGLISGTPTAAGTSMVTLSATNAGGTGNATLTLTVSPAPPVITSATTASGTVGIAFSYQIAATNSPTSYGATGLPAGLSVNSASGLISGTPTAAGTSMVTLSATNAGGTGNATLTLTINNPPPPVITSSTMATGTVGIAFSYQITATNSPASFGATGLPAGLSVNSASGLISGTPTATGTSMVTLSATNAGGTGNATLTLTINPPPPVITGSTSANGTVGSDFNYLITATNSPTSYGATGLPAGLSVDSTIGLISGQPTAAGTFMVTLSATNAGGTGNATLTLTITPAPPVISSATTASGTVGSAFSYQITATNAPTSYGAAGLPAGLSVNSASGLISGTPTAAATSTVALSATNSGGTGNATLTLTISNPPPPVITSASSASGTVGGAFSYQITATNSPTSYGATGLPGGLSVSTSSGLISGTPTSSGTSTVTLSATNAGGTGNATLTLTIAVAVPAAFVQATAATTPGTAKTVSLSFPANTTAGNLIVVAFDYTSGAAPSSVNDTQGNVFAPVGNQLSSPGGALSRVYYANTIKGGADTVTVTLTANSSWIELYLAEYTGIDPVNPIDAQAGASGKGGAVSSGTATTSVSGDVIFGYCVGDWNCTVGSGFSARSTFDGNLIEDKVAGAAGSYAATGTANNGWAMQMVALKAASGTVGAPPVITSATSATGTVGTAFSYQITATNSPTSYGATGLPAGLSVNSASGLISGTPTSTGTSSVALSATNSAGTGNATLTLTVNNPPPPVITSATSASGTVGSHFSYQITATNSPTSYGATGLPAGLSVNTANGLISGTPTATGTSMVTLSATNAGGTGNATLTLTVNNPPPPVITSATTASGTVAVAFSYQITATNSPTSYGATGLPAGLSVNSASGLISGTPTTMGTSTVTLSATNAGGTGNAALTLTINAVTLVTIVVSPQNAIIEDPGGSPSTQAYTATGYFADGSWQDLTASVVWTSTNTAVATVDATGLATSAALPGSQSAGYTSITATSGTIHGVSILSVANHTGNGFAGVLTQHNDIGRTGQNLNETVLTPALVSNTATFGKKFSQPVSGYIFGQPLYVPNVTIPGKGTHNVVYVATQGDNVYAFDADSNTGANSTPLWQVSMIDSVNHGATPGETTLNFSSQCTDVVPQVGITSTPVIDPSTNTMYVEAVSVETNGAAIHRLHALDITTGSERPQSPVVITATVPGTGDGGTTVTFNPLLQMNRPGLLLVNGVVYLGYASHCDILQYHGWLFAYDATSLSQLSVFNTSPNKGEAGIWMSGNGIAADSQANIFTVTGNGNFESTGPVVDFGDTIFRMNLNTGTLKVDDYFTPFDQNNMYVTDDDLGSGGILLLPDQPGNHPHELVGGGKGGAIYLVDRDQMTIGNQHYCSNCLSDPQIIQEIFAITGGLWSSPAYWNNTLYYWSNHDTLQAFPLTNGQMPTSATSSSSFSVGFPGATPAVSSNGATNGILWAIDSTNYGPPYQPTALPAVLHAFDPTNVANEFWNSTMAANGRDKAGQAVKFTVPTIANGKVYIGTETELDVYGPLP